MLKHFANNFIYIYIKISIDRIESGMKVAGGSTGEVIDV